MSVALLVLFFGAVATQGSIFDAVGSDSMDLIKQALKDDPGALDQTGPGGQAPLMNAVLMGKPKAVKYLLKKGADPSVPEKDGYTPMHGAGEPLVPPPHHTTPHHTTPHHTTPHHTTTPSVHASPALGILHHTTPSVHASLAMARLKLPLLVHAAQASRGGLQLHEC